MPMLLSRKASTLLLAIGILHFSFAGTAQADSELKLKTERVIVFKDGHCLIVKQGTATTDENGDVYTNEVPDAAILGSFWAVCDQEEIKSMVAGWEETKKESTRKINCTNIIEIVKSNLGKSCSFTLNNKRQVEGTLLKVLSNDGLNQENQQQLNISSSLVAMPATQQTAVNQVTGNYFVVRTKDGDMMVPTSSVGNLLIDGMISTREQTVTKTSRHKRLSMKFGKPNTNVKINLMYFRPDVRWIPTYRVDLTEQPYDTKAKKAVQEISVKRKLAEIFMQGEILNEAEDLIDVPFHVVVGVPNFRFKSVPSPMVLESDMRNLLAQAAPSIMGQGGNFVSNALYTQRMSEFRSNRAVGDEARASVEIPEELSGKGGNDLFVYEIDKLSLKKGERATVPILRTKVPYRDIYTWDIDVTHAETYAATSADSPSPLVLSENKIWRQVELINDTDLPWTTGAAMFVDGFQPLAQELLTYTSPGGICRVPVTVSVDLRGKVKDSELKRDLKAMQWRGYHYARVSGRIETELANNKAVSVPVEVRLRFGGKAKQASNSGKIALEAFRQDDWRDRQGDRINNSSLVKWTATIEPGECFEPVVDYEFWLRH